MLKLVQTENGLVRGYQGNNTRISAKTDGVHLSLARTGKAFANAVILHRFPCKTSLVSEQISTVGNGM